MSLSILPPKCPKILMPPFLKIEGTLTEVWQDSNGTLAKL